MSDLRLQFDPSAAVGVPAHVTLMFPFVPPRDLTEALIDSLEALIAGTAAFQFSLMRVNEFAEGVVYLEPEPAEPFRRLTTEIAQEFRVLPYGGVFGDEPVPHLTVGVVQEASARRQLVTELSRQVPIVINANEAWLMVKSEAGRWNLVRHMRFRA